MAVKLRLKRMGSKRKPFYRIIVADSRSPRDGKFIESVGTYDPRLESNKVTIKEDRVLYWLNTGAQPTDTVKSLFTSVGVWATFKDSKVKKTEKKETKKTTTKKTTTKKKEA